MSCTLFETSFRLPKKFKGLRFFKFFFTPLHSASFCGLESRVKKSMLQLICYIPCTKPFVTNQFLWQKKIPSELWRLYFICLIACLRLAVPGNVFYVNMKVFFMFVSATFLQMCEVGLWHFGLCRLIYNQIILFLLIKWYHIHEHLFIVSLNL